MANFCTKCGKHVGTNASFCSQCRARLPQRSGNNPSHKDKHDKVVKKNGGGIDGYVKWIFGAAIVVMLGVLFFDKFSTSTNPAIESQPVVSSSIDYSDAGQQMIDIGSKVENGKIIIPLDLIEKYRFVAFQYTSNSTTVPLLAYIAPDGKLVTAVSLCEPCSSTRFHINGDNVVCNTCGTTWKLQNLEAVSGACGPYPPDPIPSTVVGNTVQIDVKAVANWRPRV